MPFMAIMGLFDKSWSFLPIWAFWAFFAISVKTARTHDSSWWLKLATNFDTPENLVCYFFWTPYRCREYQSEQFQENTSNHNVIFFCLLIQYVIWNYVMQELRMLSRSLSDCTHYSAMSKFKFCNLLVIVSSVSKSLIH